MFSLVSGLVKWLCAKEEVNVVIVGLDHAGKTVSGCALAVATAHTNQRGVPVCDVVWLACVFGVCSWLADIA